jgi:predicted nucleic acid-binding protein
MAGDAVFVDTNVLVYASPATRGGGGSHQHAAATLALKRLEARSATPWLSRQVLREYLAVVARPNPAGLAVVDAVSDIRRFAQMFEVAEDDSGTTAKLLEPMLRIPTAGKQVHDANIVATMLAHGIPRLLTFNVADFRRFEPMIAIEPLP